MPKKKHYFTLKFYKARTEENPIRVIEKVTDVKILNKSETLAFMVEEDTEVHNLALGNLDIWFSIE